MDLFVGNAGTQNDYVYVNDGGLSFTRRILADGARLDPERFVRIHRSMLINLHQVHHVRVGESGEYSVVLRNGRALRVGRAFRRGFRERWDQVGS